MIWRRIAEHDGKLVYEAFSITGEVYRVGPSRGKYRAQTPEGFSALTVTVQASKRFANAVAERRDAANWLDIFQPDAQS